MTISDSESSDEQEPVIQAIKGKSYFTDLPVELVQSIFLYIDNFNDFNNIRRSLRCNSVITVLSSYNLWLTKLYLEFPHIKDNMYLMYINNSGIMTNYFRIRRLIKLLYQKEFLKEAPAMRGKLNLINATKKYVIIAKTHLHLLPIKFMDRRIKDELLDLYFQSLIKGDYARIDGVFVYQGHRLAISYCKEFENHHRFHLLVEKENEEKLITIIKEIKVSKAEVLNILVLLKYFHVKFYI